MVEGGVDVGERESEDMGNESFGARPSPQPNEDQRAAPSSLWFPSDFPQTLEQ